MDKIPTGEEFFIQKMFPSENITRSNN